MLEFDPVTHTYKIDGVVVPSVTELVKIYGDDADDMGADMENKLDAAAERGTTCHEIIAQMLHGETDIEYPSEYEPYVDGIRLFLSEHTIEPIAIEAPIADADGEFAGTPDLLCLFDGVLAIPDYKFVSQVAKTKVKAQLNGYMCMFNKLGVFPEKLYAIQFLPGTYRLYPVAIDPTEFNIALEVYKLKNKKHTRGKID